MSQRLATVPSNLPILVLIASLVLAGAMSATATAEELLSRSPERGGIGLDLQQLQFDKEFSEAAGRPEEDCSTRWTRGCPSLSQIKPPHRPSPSRKLWIS